VADTALDRFPDAVISTDVDGTVVRWNAAAAALLDLPPEQALGRVVSDLVHLGPRDTTGRYPARQWATTHRLTVPVEVAVWESGSGAELERHLCLRDATQRVADEDEVARAEALLRRQARYDALTGLANRYELGERLTDALAGSPEGHVACVVVDLDGFKPINDSFGHAVGDEVLAAVAARLKAAVREGNGRGPDTVARLGGDEFVILTATDAAGPAAIVQRVRQALAGPISSSAGPLRIGASIGIAVSRRDGDADDLLRRADKAMFRIKLARNAAAPPR
jgi:diguanylate cyclase (GGDEF)-like protein